jgi:hypothetical protein
MKLYEIDNEIMKCIDAATGEVFDAELLDKLNVERNAKIENTALYIKSLLAEIEAIRVEEKVLAARRKTKENRAEWLKEYLSNCLEGEEFESAKVRLSFKGSTSTEITNEFEVVEWLEKTGRDYCVKYKMPEISKTEVKKLLNAGEKIPGAVLVQKANLQIK